MSDQDFVGIYDEINGTIMVNQEYIAQQKIDSFFLLFGQVNMNN